MIKHFCDICEQEIHENQRARYRLQMMYTPNDRPTWVDLEVHERCWNMLRNEIILKVNSKIS